MLSYDMAKRGQLPLYEHLYRCIKDDILTGNLAPDDRLPSKRRLAEHLGISLITVEGAYNQLLAEGYIYTLPRKGYYVCKLPSNMPQAPVRAAQALAEHRGEAHPEPESPEKLIADFSRPTSHAQSSAAELWGKTLRSTLTHEPQEELFCSLPAQGSLRLRTAIADYLAHARGMSVSPDCIVIGAGAQMLYTYVSLLFGPQAPIALENPGYPRLKGIYGTLGHDICPIDLDADGIGVFQLERSHAQLAHVMPSHQFPTGRVMSVSRRYELLSWASRRPERYVIEDDYDWEFRFAGMPIPALESIDIKSKVIYISTFSKSLSSALRVAFMILPEPLMARFNEKLGFLANTVSALDQVALARLIESGDYEKHLNRYKKQSKATRDALIDALDGSALGGRISIEEKDSGLHFVLGVESQRSEGTIAQLAREDGIMLAPLSSYLLCTHDPASEHGIACFVMQYDGLDLEAVQAVVGILEKAVG